MIELKKKKKEVMHLMCRGYSNPEIAQILCITMFTAKAHVCSILKKLNAKNRILAVVKYICLKYGIDTLLEELQLNPQYENRSEF